MVSRRSVFRLSGLSEALTDFQSQVNQRSARVTNPHIHFLNRISWGATPEDIQRLNEIGIESYLEEQLDPYSLDDSNMDERLRVMPMLEMDRKTLYRSTSFYFRPHVTLLKAVVERAVYSKRQLLERMVDFWTDHFNVPIDDGDFGPEVVGFQRDAIRKHALGTFSQMLLATAKSPAMLTYLDNFVNVKGKPNENYARELLELHTLGVDGGYSEVDVVDVARAFTGWGIHDGTDSGFFFNQEDHDTRPKAVLGHSLPADRGIEDGLHVLNIVANHPATARFLSFKLCRRFIADAPPESIVESTTEVWRETRGSIKDVLRHIFLSDEFASSAGQKLRRPFDFVVAAMRVTGTRVHEDEMVRGMLQQAGQLPYNWLAPDGYPDTAPPWMNTGGLLVRWNIAAALTHEAYSGEEAGVLMTTRLHEQIGTTHTAGALVDAVATQVLGTPLTGQRRDELLIYVVGSTDENVPVTHRMRANKLASLYQLLLASPEFQWT